MIVAEGAMKMRPTTIAEAELKLKEIHLIYYVLRNTSADFFWLRSEVLVNLVFRIEATTTLFRR